MADEKGECGEMFLIKEAFARGMPSPDRRGQKQRTTG
jgi:hypothetical protein